MVAGEIDNCCMLLVVRQTVLDRCCSFTAFASDTVRVVKRSSKIRSSIYKFKFEFSFLAFAIRFVIVPWGRAFNKLHSCIVRISNAWLHSNLVTQILSMLRHIHWGTVSEVSGHSV